MNQIIEKVSREEVLRRVYKMLNYLHRNEISQKRIAEIIGVTDKTIRNWLSAKSYPLSDSYINLVKLYNFVKEQRPIRV